MGVARPWRLDEAAGDVLGERRVRGVHGVPRLGELLVDRLAVAPGEPAQEYDEDRDEQAGGDRTRLGAAAAGVTAAAAARRRRRARGRVRVGARRRRRAGPALGADRGAAAAAPAGLDAAGGAAAVAARVVAVVALLRALDDGVAAAVKVVSVDWLVGVGLVLGWVVAERSSDLVEAQRSAACASAQ